MKRGLKQVGEFGAPPGCWRGQCHKKGGGGTKVTERESSHGGGRGASANMSEREREGEENKNVFVRM